MKRKEPRITKTGNRASIVGGWLYLEDTRICDVDSDEFWEQLSSLKSVRLISLARNYYQAVYIPETRDFLDEDINCEMTLRKERRGLNDHWYAYRRVVGVLRKKYVGYSESINGAKLLEIAQSMPSA